MDVSLLNFNEDCNIGSQDFIRTYLLMDVGDLPELMVKLLGSVGDTRIKPHEHPDHSGFYCSAVKVAQNNDHGLGVMKDGLDDNLKCVQEFDCRGGIVVYAVYRALTPCIIAETTSTVTENTDKFDCINLRTSISVKSVVISKSPLCWLKEENDWQPIAEEQISYEDVRPQRAQSFTTIQVDRLMVPAKKVPWEQFALCVGTVNSKPISIADVPGNFIFKCFPTTLRLEPPIFTNRTDYLGNRYYDITISMSYYDQGESGGPFRLGWNSLLHPKLMTNVPVAVMGNPNLTMFKETSNWIRMFNIA